MSNKMSNKVKLSDLTIFAELDMVYNQVRVLEAQQNQTEYKCLGSGQCCHIGLILPMMECANIAFKLNQQFYLYLEDKGEQFAREWFDGVKKSLIEAMDDPDWEWGGPTKRWCAFYKNGCTIYGYRPLVCRSFGTITTVDEYCPRIRNAHGHIDHFAGEPVRNLVRQYQALLKRFAKDKDMAFDTVVYMPLGVLSFLLSDQEMIELSKNTDERMWKAVQGWFNYRVHYLKEHGLSVEEIRREAEAVGVEVAFRTDQEPSIKE